MELHYKQRRLDPFSKRLPSLDGLRSKSGATTGIRILLSPVPGACVAIYALAALVPAPSIALGPQWFGHCRSLMAYTGKVLPVGLAPTLNQV